MKPTEEQIKEFWEWCGFRWHGRSGVSPYWGRFDFSGWMYPDSYLKSPELPPIDLNNLFKYAPEVIVGITFRYYPGGCECELIYITEAGFDTVRTWVKNETTDEKQSKSLSALALFWAIWEVINEKD